MQTQDSTAVENRQLQLSNEELAELIQAGETKYIQQLWNQVYKFITMKAKDYYGYAVNSSLDVRFELDDLKQEGFFAMISAIKYFSSGNGSFLTVLGNTLKTSFANVSGKRKRSIDALDVSISGDTPKFDDDYGTILDYFPDEASMGEGSVETLATFQIEQKELHDVLEKCLGMLPDNQETILRELYYQHREVSDIAKELKCTKQNIYLQKGNALDAIYDARNINGLAEYLDNNTNFYRKSSVQSFNRTGSSVVEMLVLQREQLTKKWMRLQKAEMMAVSRKKEEM